MTISPLDLAGRIDEIETRQTLERWRDQLNLLITQYNLGLPGSGTVTNVSAVNGSGLSWSIANPTTTPAITLTLGAIAPTSVAASGTVSGSNLSGTNTGDQTNISGNAATVTTNANLTGPITSSGNATSIASQTGTGTKFVVDTSPTLVTPNIGAATGTSLQTTGNITVNAGTITGTNGGSAAYTNSPIVASTAAGRYGFRHTDGTRELVTYIDSSGGWIGTSTNHDINFFTNDGSLQFALGKDKQVSLPIDDKRMFWGGGYDASIRYDGTNMLINPKEVGSGILDILGSLQTDGYNAADGSAGISTTITSALLVGKTITVKNGLITGFA